MADNNDNDTETDESENNGAEIDFSNLSDEQRDALSAHPEVRKMLTYEETSIPQVAAMMRNMQNPEDAENPEDVEEAYSLLVSGIADRRGRITESTVRKVLSGLVEEYDSVN